MFCLRKLEWYEYCPLFGWLLRSNALKLPCPCGKQKGLWAQPVAEITGLILGITAVAFNGWSWSLLPLCLGLGILPAIALVDLFFSIIPDELNIALGLCGLGWLILGDGDVFMGLVTSAGLLAFSLFLAIVYSKWRGKEMLGLGDVKLFAASGFWLAPLMVPWFFTIAGVVGAVFGLLWKRAGGGKEFPFGPAICTALAGCVYYQLWLMVGDV